MTDETTTNMLCFGDNLEVMREEYFRDAVPYGSIQLIYTDPPFNSKRTYNETIRSEAGKASFGVMEAFKDTWSYTPTDVRALLEPGDRQLKSPGLRAAVAGIEVAYRDSDPSVVGYAAMLAPRLDEMYHLLAPSGWFVMHGDPTIVNIQQMLLDGLFDRENYANTVAWCYSGPGNYRSYFPRKHDTLLVYAKQLSRAKFYPDRVRIPYKKPLAAARARTGIFNGQEYGDLDERLEAAEKKGKLVEDWWVDITPPGRIKGENLGYPTQKPKKLARRLVEAFTDPGDVVFDPFEGGGTTLVAAQEAGRGWVGIDINVYAAAKTADRMRRLFGDDDGFKYRVRGTPVDYESAKQLFNNDDFAFETWAVLEVGGTPTKRKRGPDGGIDGRLPFQFVGQLTDANRKGEAIISVKGGKLKATDLDAMMGVVDAEGAFAGILVTLEEPSNSLIKRAERWGTVAHNGVEYPKCQFLWLKRAFEVVHDKHSATSSIAQVINLPKQRGYHSRATGEHVEEMVVPENQLGLFEV